MLRENFIKSGVQSFQNRNFMQWNLHTTHILMNIYFIPYAYLCIHIKNEVLVLKW